MPLAQEQVQVQALNKIIKFPIIKKFWDYLSGTTARINFLYGGASSGKSHSMGQFFVQKFFEEEHNKQFLVVRKTLPALRITAYKLVIDLIEQYGIPKRLNKSEMLLQFNGNEMRFKSLDDPEKIKSFNVNYIWAEELTDFTLKDFRRLLMILRAPNEKQNQLFATFNPIDAFHWINTKFMSKSHDKNILDILHSTYIDNPFNTQEYIQELEALKDEDEQYYFVYTKGKWGIRKNIIYNNWETISFQAFPSYDNCDFTIYGMDFGFTNPSAITEIRFKDGIIYERELLYEAGLTNPELITKAEILIPDKLAYIYADSAEPARIKEFKRKGFQNIRPAKKGKGSVAIGIDFVKRHKQYIASTSTNLIDEKRAYKYKEDSNGKVLEIPVEWLDHLMDAERMAIYTHLVKMGAKKGGAYFRRLAIQKKNLRDEKSNKDSSSGLEEETKPITKLLKEEKKKDIILTPRTNRAAKQGGVFYRGR